MTKTFACLLAVSLATTALAAEPPPSETEWTPPDQVESLYVGDYNAPQGQAYIFLPNSGFHTWDLGSEYARMMYATALLAKASGLTIRLLRNKTASGGYFPAYRIVLQP